MGACYHDNGRVRAADNCGMLAQDAEESCLSVMLQSSPFLLGRLSHFTLLSLPSPPPFSMLDLHGLFFCSIVGQTFNIEKGGGGTSEKRDTLIYK